MGNKYYYIIDAERDEIISKRLDTLEEAKLMYDKLLHNSRYVIVETVFG